MLCAKCCYRSDYLPVVYTWQRSQFHDRLPECRAWILLDESLSLQQMLTFGHECAARGHLQQHSGLWSPQLYTSTVTSSIADSSSTNSCINRQAIRVLANPRSCLPKEQEFNSLPFTATQLSLNCVAAKKYSNGVMRYIRAVLFPRPP